MGQAPPIVSAIQAIDQYGNVLASAQNPKAFQLMQQWQSQQKPNKKLRQKKSENLAD